MQQALFPGISRVFKRAKATLYTRLFSHRLFQKIFHVPTHLFVIGIIVGGSAFYASGQTYGGEAAAVIASVDTALTPVTRIGLADTGELPETGGTISFTNSGTSVLSGLVQVGASIVTTSGTGGTSHSDATVQGVNVSLGNLGIHIDALDSTTNVSCSSSTGSFSIATGNVQNVILINGIQVAVSATDVTTIDLAVFSAAHPELGLNVTGTLKINERIGSARSFVVNGIHLNAHVIGDTVVADVVVSSARSDIHSCANQPPQNIYEGRGYGVGVTQATGLGTLNLVSTTNYIEDTGLLSPSGGSIAGSTLSAGVNSLIGTGNVATSTSGGVAPSTVNSDDSDTVVNDLGVNLSAPTGGILPPIPITIGADNVHTHSNCTAVAGVVTCTGSTTLVGLAISVAGLPIVIPVNPPPNFSLLDLDVGLAHLKIILNEQITAPGSITVNALHVGLGVAGIDNTDAIVASSHSALAVTNIVTAAGVSISGRILDPNGMGIKAATVSVTDEAGRTYMALTNQFGFYTIGDLPAGGFYTIQASSRSYLFKPQFVSLQDSLTGFNLTAIPPPSRR